MRQVVDRTGDMTGSGIGWALASSAAAHFVLAGVLLLAGAAGGFRGRGATVVAVDLVAEEPGIGGPLASASSGAPRRVRGFPALPRGEDIPSPRAEGRPGTAAPEPVRPAEVTREPAVAVPAPLPAETIVPGPAAVISHGPEAPGPTARIGTVVAGPAPEGMRPGAGLVSTLSGGADVASIAGAGPAPGARERDGSGARTGEHGLLRDRIQSRIVYPAEAVRRRLEGEVLLRIRIETGGNPGEIRVARSSGARLLDDAARRGVVRAAPLPASPGWVEIPVLFRLR